ncbi:hypothetical protein BH10PSE14_BH10PSE14_42980 [soil metagenome]
MADGRLFLGISTLICIGAFLNGRRFARMTKNPWANRRILGLPVSGSELPIERVRLIGRINMIGAPVFWLIVAAMCFGLLGPVDGVATIPTPWSVR